MAVSSAHRNEPRFRIAWCATPILTGEITSETLPSLLAETRSNFEKEIPRILELVNLYKIRPWLLDHFSYIDSESTRSHHEPSTREARTLQHSCQNVLRFHYNFSLIVDGLKNNDAEREELFALFEDTFAELPDLSHFKYCIKPIDITGNNDYRYVTVPDLYGLNDLIEYSVVFFTTNPLHSSSLIGECPWCEQCFPKSRTNQKFCRKKCKNKKTNADKKTREEELITA